jgi:hypothetical protein
VTARRAGVLVAVALAAAALLIGIELGTGGLSYGAPEVRNPCAQHAPFPGSGLDSATQRVALRGLDVAACRLGTTREVLLLSLAGREDIGRTPAELEGAVRDGLEEAIKEEDLNPVADWVLRQAVEHTPVSWVLSIAKGLGLIS